MPIGFEYSVTPSFRDLLGRFSRANAALFAARLPALRRLGAAWVDFARQEAPKRTGKFAKALGFRTFADGDQMGFRATMAQPLGDWILRGTRAHTITAHHGALRFQWGEGPRGAGVYFFRSVHHPGTKANAFAGRAYRRWLPGARAELRRLGLNYQRTLTSGAVSGQI